MKLSMWMIVNQLRDFSLEIHIEDGSQTIGGVRFFLVEPDLKHEFLCIGDASNVISDVKYSDAIVLVHGYDIIFVLHQDIETVLNRLLSIMDFYNSWEASLWEAAASPNPLQKIIDLSNGILSGPAFIADRLGKVLALDENFTPKEPHEIWNSIYGERRLHIETASSPVIKDGGLKAEDWTANPIMYHLENGMSYIGAYIIMDGETVAAFCILGVDNDLKKSDVQIACVMCPVITTAIRNQEIISAVSSSVFLNNMIKGEQIDGDLFERLCGNAISKPWRIISIRNIFAPKSTARNTLLLNAIKSTNTSSVCSVYSTDIVVLISSEDMVGFMKELAVKITPSYFAIGISLPFYIHSDLAMRYQQSQFALEQGDGAAGIFNLADYAYSHMTSILREQKRLASLSHPALDLLRHYDSKHDADLFNTLQCYLKNERNAVQTAKQLYIHRNTMLSRLKKLAELLSDVDLDNSEIREHILISYIVHET